MSEVGFSVCKGIEGRGVVEGFSGAPPFPLEFPSGGVT